MVTCTLTFEDTPDGKVMMVAQAPPCPDGATPAVYALLEAISLIQERCDDYDPIQVSKH